MHGEGALRLLALPLRRLDVIGKPNLSDERTAIDFFYDCLDVRLNFFRRTCNSARLQRAAAAIHPYKFSSSWHGEPHPCATPCSCSGASLLTAAETGQSRLRVARPSLIAEASTLPLIYASEQRRCVCWRSSVLPSAGFSAYNTTGCSGGT